MEYELENPLTGFQEHQANTIPYLFSSESDHMPCENYISSFKTRDLDVSVRRQVISSILQFSCNFDPFIPYLAVNYLDRFISRQNLPHGKPWMLKLLGISCVSLAAKMKQIDFSLADFQREEGLIFDTETIQRMELLILGALKWRMRSITPFSFVYYFLSFFKLKDPPLRQALKARASEIIFKAQCEIKLLEFKPSIIAASALLSASHELFPLQFPCFRKAISSSIHVNKERLLDCSNEMHRIVMDSYESVFDKVAISKSSSSTVKTPVNVLDLDLDDHSQSGQQASCCCCSLGSTVRVRVRSSESNSIIDVPINTNKRRKMSDLCCNTNNNSNSSSNEKSFQLSQIQQC